MKNYLSASFLIIATGVVLCACTMAASASVTKPGSSPGVPSASTPAPVAEGTSSLTAELSLNDSTFVMRSLEVVEGGMLPQEYTCDGSSTTLPLEWSCVPAGTKSLALIMHTIPGPNESHWYWVLYNIPPETKGLAKNVSCAGTPGNNSVNGRTEYAPPCSKGPGAKKYTYTIYALSAPPQFNVSPDKVSRDVLLSAIEDRTIDSAELNVYYSR